MKRTIINIDESKCDGCGNCVEGCLGSKAMDFKNDNSSVVTDINNYNQPSTLNQ